MKREHTTPPHLRVHCANNHFVGEKVTVTTAKASFLAAISQCDSCQAATCMICRTQLDTDAPLANVFDHGCKARLDAEEKQRKGAFDGLERGKDYQHCPTCHRDIELSAACNHVTCLCGTHFCYQCGEPAVPADGHWGSDGCPLYPTYDAPAQAVFQAPEPQRRNRIREVEPHLPRPERDGMLAARERAIFRAQIQAEHAMRERNLRARNRLENLGLLPRDDDFFNEG